VYTAGLGNCFDVNMDNSGHYTMQQRTKLAEAYFTRAMQEIFAEKKYLTETGSVANANKGHSS